MINFNENSVFNLTPIDIEKVRDEVENLLISNEFIVAAFHTIRDQVIFTNKRVIAIDVQGITGMKKDYTSLPYSKVQYYGIQTPGFMEIIADSQLCLHFNDGFEALFEFKGACDIIGIGRCVSEYVLNDID